MRGCSRFGWAAVLMLAAVALFGMVAMPPGPAAAQSGTQGTAQCPAREAPNGVEVCVDRGEGAVYHEGDPITVCVTVSIPVIAIYPPPPPPQIRVTNSINNSPPRTIFEERRSSGQRCINAVIIPPFGRETIQADVIAQDGKVIASDTVRFTSVPRAGQPGALSVSVDRGPGAVYTLGEAIRICYTVPAPGWVTILDILPDGNTRTLLAGADDGTGGCFWGTVTPPTGQECLRLVYTAAGRTGSREVCFQVVGSTPPGQPCILIYPPPPGCADPNTPVSSHGGPVHDLVSLIDALRAAGATVTPAEPLDDPETQESEEAPQLLTGIGWQITVNGEGVQVYEYADEAAAAADAARVSPDGTQFGDPPTISVSWMAPPHFYRAGPLIVLYIGDDAEVLRALEAVLGPQFAGQ